MPVPIVFMDTSFIIALENPHDPYHAKAHAIDDRLSNSDTTYLFHWGVMLEIGDGFARLDRRQRGIDLLEQFSQGDGYEVVGLSGELLKRAISLYQDRRDKTWGLTDCVSFVLMKERGISDALTADVHFQQAGFKALLLDS